MYALPFVGYKHRFYVQYALYFCFYGIAFQWHKKAKRHIGHSAFYVF